MTRTFELIAEYPQSRRTYEGETRHFLHGSHIILYRIVEDGVLIGRVFHGARGEQPDD